MLNSIEEMKPASPTLFGSMVSRFPSSTNSVTQMVYSFSSNHKQQTIQIPIVYALTQSIAYVYLLYQVISKLKTADEGGS